MARLSDLLANVESTTLLENKKCKKNKKSAMAKEAVVEALETVLEMVENEALSDIEVAALEESIESIFNTILTESEEDYEDEQSEDDYEDEESEEDYEDEESEEVEFACNDDFCETEEPCCEWTGTESELDENEDGEMVCPNCGSSVSELSDDEESEEDYEDEESYDDEESEEDYEDEEFTESVKLDKSTSQEKMAAKQYARSAAGKKTMKLQAKKRKKYATQISRCADKGQVFSFRTMACAKKKERR